MSPWYYIYIMSRHSTSSHCAPSTTPSYHITSSLAPPIIVYFMGNTSAIITTTIISHHMRGHSTNLYLAVHTTPIVPYIQWTHTPPMSSPWLHTLRCPTVIARNTYIYHALEKINALLTHLTTTAFSRTLKEETPPPYHEKEGHPPQLISPWYYISCPGIKHHPTVPHRLLLHTTSHHHTHHL